MKRLFPASLTFVVSFFSGFQLFAVIHLLPYLLKLVEDTNSIDLVIVIAFVVLIFSQLELGKRISIHAAAHAIRDSVVGQSVAFLVFVLAPQSFWLIVAFIAWLTGFSATQIALGRWTLLANKVESRRMEAGLSLLGLAAGISLSKTIPFFGGGYDLMIYSGLVLTIGVSYYTHLFAKQTPGFFSHSQAWHWREIVKDVNMLALFGVSIGMGSMLGLVIFRHSKIMMAVYGIFLFFLLSRQIYTFVSVEKAIRFSFYGAAVVLVVDLIFNDTILFSSVIMPFAAGVVYTSVRLAAFAPRISLSTSERMSFHGLGIYMGLSLCGISKLPWITFEQTAVGVLLLLVAIAYAISFLPDARPAVEPAHEEE